MATFTQEQAEKLKDIIAMQETNESVGMTLLGLPVLMKSDKLMAQAYEDCYNIALLQHNALNEVLSILDSVIGGK